MVRRRLRASWTLIRVVTCLCALCLCLSQCVTWVQVWVFQLESEKMYRLDLTLRRQACRDQYHHHHRHHDFPTTTTNTTTTINTTTNNNNNNITSSFSSSSSSSFPERQLFFKTCRADLNPHPPAAYRLGLPASFKCLEEKDAKTLLTSPSRSEHTHSPAAFLRSSGGTPSSHSGQKTKSLLHFPFTQPTHLADDAVKADDSDDERGPPRGPDLLRTCHGHMLVPGGSQVPSVPFQQPCLKRFVEGRCRDGRLVPRLVHYVWFSRHAMDLVTFLSVLAAYRFLEPCLILFHADSVPQGPYWRALPSLVPVLLLVQRTAPVQVFGRPLGVVQHKSDIARLEALKEYGGIYLDGDQVVLKSLDEFRDKEFVMGHENPKNLANSLLVSAPQAKFIDVWYRNYRSYNPRQWGIHSTFLPLTLAHVYPGMIHNAGYAFIKPDLPGIREIWEGHYNWTKNHAVHLYYRSMVQGKQVRTNYTLDELLALNTSLGEIARHVVFGSKDVCRG